MNSSLDFPPIEAPPLVEQPRPTTAVSTKPASELSLEAFDLTKLALAYLAPLRADAAAVKKKFTGLVVDVSTQSKIDEGRSLVHRLVAKPIAAARKTEAALKDKLNGTKTDVVAEAAAIIALFDEAAQPVRAQLDEGQAKLDEEKRQKAAAEAARVAAHEAGIAKIRSYLTRCQEPGMTAERILTGIQLLAAVAFGPEWQDFAERAKAAQAETLAAMRALHTQALEREAAAAAAEAQRVENERVAAEQAARQAELDARAAEIARREQAAEDEITRVEHLKRQVASIHRSAERFECEHNHSSSEIAETIAALEQLDVSEAAFQEFASMAADARRLVLAALLKAKDEAEARESAEIAQAAETSRSNDLGRLGANIPPDVESDSTPAADLFGVAPAPALTIVPPDVALADCREALREALLMVQELVNDMDQTGINSKRAADILARVSSLRALGGI